MTLFCRKYSRNQAGIVVSFWHKTVRNCAECLVVQRLCAASYEKNSTDCQKEVMVIFYEHVGQDSFFYEDRDIFFPAHIHRQLEIFYLLEGETEIRLDQKRFLMHSGELLCVFPNQIHSYESHGSTRFYIGLLNPAELRENGAVFTKHRCLSPVLPISDFHPELLRCMEAAASFYKKGQALKRPGRFFGYMNVIADILAETLSLGLRKEGEEEILSQVLRWILEHYREKITQEQVARAVGISRFTLSRLFAEKMECSFLDYLNRLRVECSLELLQDGHLTVNQAGEACGFQSESSFFRHFRRCMGMTPLQYRKAGRREATGTARVLIEPNCVIRYNEKK